MKTFLQKAGPACAAWFGLLNIVWAFVARGEVFLIVGSILFGSAMIAVQIEKIADRQQE